MRNRLDPVLLLVAFLGAAVGAVYLQTAGAGFILFDDPAYVFENPQVSRGLTAGGAGWAFTTTHAGFYIPLVWLSHMADVSLFGLWAGGHHLVNAALHLANALLLFLVLRSLTGSRWRSALAAALWSLHPLRVESVAWVAERKDVLSGTFLLLALWAWSAHAHSPSLRRLLTAAGLFLAALLSKPSVVVFPLLLLLLDFWPLGRLEGGGWGRARALLGEKVPFLLLALPVAAATYFAHQSRGGIRAEDLVQRAANALLSLGDYLLLTVRPSGLAILYPARPAGAPLLPLLAWAALLVLLTWGAVAVRRRLPGVTVGWLWFLVALLPVIGLVPHGAQSIADRFTYLPHMGLAIALAYLAGEAVRRFPRSRPLVAAGAVALALLLGFLSHRQAAFWRESETLFRRALQVTERNWLISFNLGVVLEGEGRNAEAEALFRDALAWQPSFPSPHFHLARVLARQGKEGEAERRYRDALALRSSEEPFVRREMAWLLLAQGRAAEAASEFKGVLEVLAGDPAAGEGLFQAQAMLGQEGGR